MDNNTMVSRSISDEVAGLKRHLDDMGIKYSWLTEKLKKDPSWITKLFKGTYQLTPENKVEIETVLGITL